MKAPPSPARGRAPTTPRTATAKTQTAKSVAEAKIVEATRGARLGEAAARVGGAGTEVGATRGFLRSMAAMLRDESVTHVACAFDHRTRMLPFINAGMMMQLPNTASFSVNYTAPYATGLTGTKYFQYWFRSGLATGTGSNSSDGVAISF